jgi:bifunctional enzyme CysN/CysC
VNKMDLLDWDEARFREIREELDVLCGKLGFNEALAIPVSALNGDNVVEPSESTPWYDGATLLGYLEEVEVASDRNMRESRMPVQWVVRPMSEEHHDYRALAGEIASGVMRKGDEVVVLPSGKRTTIEAIDGYDGELEEAFAPMSVKVRLADQLDVSRGDVICDSRSAPTPAREIVADLCWMSDRELRPRGRYLLMHGPTTVKAIVGELSTVVDIGSLDHAPAGGAMELNDIGRVTIRVASPLVCDPYRENRATGCFILVDEATNDTVAAGMVVEAHA